MFQRKLWWNVQKLYCSVWSSIAEGMGREFADKICQIPSPNRLPRCKLDGEDYDPQFSIQTLRVQVPNNQILTHNLYYNSYYPNPKYRIIGYMDPVGKGPMLQDVSSNPERRRPFATSLHLRVMLPCNDQCNGCKQAPRLSRHSRGRTKFSLKSCTVPLFTCAAQTHGSFSKLCCTPAPSI